MPSCPCQLGNSKILLHVAIGPQRRGEWMADDSSLLLLVKMLRRTSKNNALYLKTISSVPFTRESQVVRRFDQYFYHISCRMSTGEHAFVRKESSDLASSSLSSPSINFATSNKQQATMHTSTKIHTALSPSPAPSLASLQTRSPSRATNHRNHNHHHHNHRHNHHHQ